MKFSTKIILSTTVIFMCFFMGLGTILIGKNFRITYEDTKDANLRQHFSEVYTLRNNLISDISRGQEITNDVVVRYVNRFVSYSQTSSAAVVSKENEVIYTSVGKNFTTGELVKFANDYNGKGILIKRDGQSFMIMSTTTVVGDFYYSLLHIFDVTSMFVGRSGQIQFFAVAAAICMMLSVILVLIMASVVTKPIQKLNEASKQIAKGNYGVRTAVASKDEIGELSVSFDSMVSTLEDDIRRREAFIADFSHELKTPMTAIVGYADILRSQQCNEDEKFQYANYIYKSGKRLENLSTSMMSLLGLAERKLVLNAVDMKKIIQSVKFIFKAHTQVCYEFDMEPAFVKGDFDLLVTLLRNLIDNARKSEPRDGKVTITGTNHGECYEIQVCDKGRGMKQEEISRVTEAFYMADKSRSRSQGGAGIGLSICEKICTLHGSQLQFESELGVGTKVKVELEVWHE